ncbi:hypothetical protein Cgig2_034116 [Carnegiea gigantea]|uniref:Uncharacterized protein n=1 Tax=Carnegiea gigantea TaxID=171969 RepID=A0A9Q1K2E4_9CARY|nr:hypothetical protein Cgig2_034116 [Carnegiea gigantea]
METHRDKEGSYHEPATKKFVMATSEVVFFEATVPAEIFAYHKFMGPKNSRRVGGVGFGITSINLTPNIIIKGDDVEENQRTTTPLAGEHIRDTLATTPTLAKNNEVYIKDAGQIENSTVLRDKSRATHTSRLPHALNQVRQQRRSAGGEENIQNSLQGVNKSYTTQIG